MIIYFAISSTGKHYWSALDRCKVSNVLVSYAFPRTVLKAIDHLESYYPNNRLVLDSGAYSAWTKGKAVDVKAYADFCHEILAKAEGKVQDVHIVGLDVIPGEAGKNPTADDISDSAERGWVNYEAMVSYGLSPIHTFHQFEGFEWLEKLADHQGYIGISPSNACSPKQRASWLRHVFSRLKQWQDDRYDHEQGFPGPLRKTHGFGVTSPMLMESFPWYSVDSTSWCAVDMWGRPNFTAKRDRLDLWFNSQSKPHRGHVLVNEIRELQRLEKVNTSLWAERGIVWPDGEGRT